MDNDLSFCELRRLEVINGSDGRRMGHIVDMLFSADTGKIKGIILPYGKRGIFGKSQDLFVPWKCVQKIGEDVIIIEINDCPADKPSCDRNDCDRPSCDNDRPPAHGRPPARPRLRESDCDGKCEKCMLFDCAKRWQSA